MAKQDFLDYTGLEYYHQKNVALMDEKDAVIANTLSTEIAVERERIDFFITNTLGCITPQMYGAKGDGVTDDTDAFSNMINEHNKTGNYIYIPKGTYIINGELPEITVGGLIFGNGEIKCSSEINSLFHISAPSKIMGITLNVTGCESAILIENTRQCIVEGCTIIGDNKGITLKDSIICAVKDCYILHCKNGINIISNNVDTGDHYFFGNTFDCREGANKTALVFNSGGGIRFSNNKVLTYDKAIYINSTGETSVLVIDGNSFENGTTCLYVDNEGSYGRIIFSNNQVTKYNIILNKNAYEIQITDNIFSGSFIENSICCSINDIQGRVSFEGNVVVGFRYGIYSYKNIKDLKISDNNYDDFCKKLVMGNTAILNESFDKLIICNGSAFNLIRVIPVLNGSGVVEVIFSGAINKYSLLRIINTDGNMTCEKLYGDDIFTCSNAGTLVCNFVTNGETYARVNIKGCVNTVEGV